MITPGLVIIRQKDGIFVADSSGNIFNVPQLARSITNLPVYLTNGNTPQGIFAMHGFDVSNEQLYRANGKYTIVDAGRNQFTDLSLTTVLFQILSGILIIIKN